MMARILVVDDTAFMRRTLEDLLTGAGHEVVATAGDGVEALEKWREHRPDVTTLDITMPTRSGLEALGDILAEDPDARVVICSAVQQEKKVLEALQGGAREFIRKPFRNESVIAAVEQALK
jgi:two-component system chemotaxis response regulator CheY